MLQVVQGLVNNPTKTKLCNKERCYTCKHWGESRDNGTVYRHCNHNNLQAMSQDNNLAEHGKQFDCRILTSPSFGCIKYEEKLYEQT